MKKPNFLIITTDENRYPPYYESDLLKEWRKKNLIAEQSLIEQSYQFHNHYISSIACTPSRTCIYTGQYPTLHQVTQTYGGAKEHDDPLMQWLEPNTVPTMGNYFELAGYDCTYKGKWHISYEDIVINGTAPQSNDNPVIYEAYVKENKLKPFGFDGWIGPEPHGSSKDNTGTIRDEQFSREAVEWLEERKSKSHSEADNPFLLVCSLVNPHDIVFYEMIYQAFQFDNDEKVPLVNPSPTENENLSTKPSVQQAYIDNYTNVFPAILNREKYRQVYFQLLKRVDNEVLKVLEALKRTGFDENTVIIYTSDHGEQLGSHNGFFQKWYNAYQETLHVPMLIRMPNKKKENIYSITNHVDIIPTMLGLIGADMRFLYYTLKKTHSVVYPLVGNDLSRILRGKKIGNEDKFISYFYQEDLIFKGRTQYNQIAKVFTILQNVTRFEYDTIFGPTTIECIVFKKKDKASLKLNQNEALTRTMYKFAHYFDNPKLWTVPYVVDIYEYKTGPYQGSLLVRNYPQDLYDPEYEFYNLDTDPSEEHNLWNIISDKEKVKLQSLMKKERDKKALKAPYPYRRTTKIPMANYYEYNNKYIDLAKAMIENPFIVPYLIKTMIRSKNNNKYF